MGLHLKGMHLVGIQFMGMHLMGMHLIGVHLMVVNFMGTYYEDAGSWRTTSTTTSPGKGGDFAVQASMYSKVQAEPNVND